MEGIMSNTQNSNEKETFEKKNINKNYVLAAAVVVIIIIAIVLGTKKMKLEQVVRIQNKVVRKFFLDKNTNLRQSLTSMQMKL